MTGKLPININHLLRQRTIEGERVEYKAGWNPQSVLHTVCAFANDFHNLGGGYVVLGVKERDGRPVLPPKGIPPDSVDAIQEGTRTGRGQVNRSPQDSASHAARRLPGAGLRERRGPHLVSGPAAGA